MYHMHPPAPSLPGVPHISHFANLAAPRRLLGTCAFKRRHIACVKLKKRMWPVGKLQPVPNVLCQSAPAQYSFWSPGGRIDVRSMGAAFRHRVLADNNWAREATRIQVGCDVLLDSSSTDLLPTSESPPLLNRFVEINCSCPTGEPPPMSECIQINGLFVRLWCCPSRMYVVLIAGGKAGLEEWSSGQLLRR